MIISQTPYRVSFFGGGTDYPDWFKNNPAAVLATSINKYCYITCRHLPPFFDYKTRIIYAIMEKVKDHKDIKHPVVRAALKLLDIQDGLEIHYDGDLPARSGIGSSSTFTVGLLHALYALKNKMPSKLQLAQEAINIEQKILKENVGSQDQITSAYGGFNRIEFHNNESFTVSPIPITKERLNELNDHLLLFFSGIARLGSVVAKDQIQNIPKNMQYLNQMYEMVEQATEILTSKTDISEFGKMLHNTWEIKKQLSAKITTQVIDDAYNEAISAGAVGGKLLGAGSGGFILIFAKPSEHKSIKNRLGKLLHVPFRFESSGTRILYLKSDSHSQSS